MTGHNAGITSDDLTPRERLELLRHEEAEADAARLRAGRRRRRGRVRNLSPGTIEHYEWAIRSFRSSYGTDFESQMLADLEPEAVRD